PRSPGRVAAHAAALRAVLPRAGEALSRGERQLMIELLDRLVEPT
ncbi:MAG: hypothetical protein JWP97_2023, partial [Labilithrix sp.]|nr:hypothetical protein [Labilithrix sp.]